jgi:hypothetical protein
VTLERTTALPARMDVVLYPQATGETGAPQVERLHQDEKTTAFGIRGDGFYDLFILCEEDAGPVTVGPVRFEGRALLVRHQPELQAFAVNPVSVTINGKPFAVES